MTNREPKILKKEEAKDQIAQLVVERVVASRIRDAAGAQEPISIASSPIDSLGDTYYDLEGGSAHQERGAANDDDDDVIDIYGAVLEHFEDVKDITEEDL